MESLRQSFSGRAAVTGVGMTDLTRYSGVSELQLAKAAATAAIADAGLQPADIDAVLCYHLNDSAPVNDVARALGLSGAIWTNEIFGGGTQSASILADAAMLIESRTAKHVLLFRALNSRSGKRMGQTGLRLGGGNEGQFLHPYGMAGPVNQFALSSARWMYDVGAGQDDLAAVVVQSRELARENPRAVRRDGMTREQYFAEPWIAEPLRRADCCQETDGATALVISSTQLADRLRPGSPRIHTVLRGGGDGASRMDKSADLSTIFSRHLAGPLWARSGLLPRHVGVALLYDAYSPIVLQQLEDFGFCERGAGGDLFRSGSTLPAGTLPVNPHGGLLSEGYVHGLNNVAEAVRQLRGTADIHQVVDPEFALCSGFGGSYGSAALLARG